MFIKEDLLEMLENLPEELKSKNIWLGYALKLRNDGIKYDKIPVSIAEAIRGQIKYVTASDKQYHHSFDVAYKALEAGIVDGLGVSLVDTDICIVDIDDAVDSVNGTYRFSEDVRYMLNRFDSFSEISLSEKGIHIFMKGRKSKEVLNYKYRTLDGEIYDGADKRSFIAVTGCVIHDGEVGDRQDIINSFCSKVAPKGNSLKEKNERTRPPKLTVEQLQTKYDESVWFYGLAHDEILDVIWRNERLHDNYQRFIGNPPQPPSGIDDSLHVHDYRLARCFAYHTRDFDMTLQLMYLSGLYRAKWEKVSGRDEKGNAKSYIEVTVYNALAEIVAIKGINAPKYKAKAKEAAVNQNCLLKQKSSDSLSKDFHGT